MNEVAALSVHNTDYADQLAVFDADLKEAASELKPWQVKVAGLRYQGKSGKDIAPLVKKDQRAVMNFIKSAECTAFMTIKREMEAFKNGPTESERKHWLVQIVNNCLNEEPKEARGAIQELNRMDKKEEGGNANVNIVINNVLARGVLDG